MKKTNLWVAVALMTALTAMMGCGNDGDADDQPDVTDPTQPSNEGEINYIELTRAQQQLVKGSNDFAFNLFRLARSGQSSTASGQPSMVLSPISVTYALGMLNNGAAGQTQQQICQVLGFGDTGADGINDFCRKMLTDAPRLDKQTKVLIANTVFMNQPYRLLPDFVHKAADYYDATPETRNFHDGKTLGVINQWGSDHTEKMIEKVLSEDEFDADAVSYLLNAIYFKGTWTSKFDKDETKNETFHASTDREVPMMHQNQSFNYGENDLCQMLCLPFGNALYRMTVLLPREGKTIDDVLQTLTAENWLRQYSPYENAIVDVKLPRFESNTNQNLVEMMKQLGMTDAFNPDVADFSAFCYNPTYISLMKQVARIKIDEQGGEAAAVTVIGMLLTSTGEHQEPRHVNFHATRPFLYVISEQSSGAIFFIGQYMGD